MTLKNYFTPPATTGIFWGVLGGVVLIVSTYLTNRGPLHMLAYPPSLITSILIVAFTDKANISFKRLFITGFITFMVMSLILYLNIELVLYPHRSGTLFGHTWRLAFMAIIGVASSALVSGVVVKLIR